MSKEESVQDEMEEILNDGVEPEGEGTEAPAEAAEATPDNGDASDVPPEESTDVTGEQQAESPSAEDVQGGEDSSKIDALMAELSRIRESNRALTADKAARDMLSQQPAFMPQQPVMPQAQPGVPQQTQQPADLGPEVYNLFDAEGNAVQIPNPNYAVQQAMAPMQGQIDAFMVSQINASESAARERHADFDHALNGWDAEVRANPALVQQMRHSSDPGEFAYVIGLNAAGPAPVAPAATKQPTQVPATQEAPKPKLPGTLSDKASPGGANTSPPVSADPLDRALMPHFAE